MSVPAPPTDAAELKDFPSYIWRAHQPLARVHRQEFGSLYFGTDQDGRWNPPEHEDDHKSRRAFTFALLAPSETESLGCLYLNPLHEYLLRAGAPAQVVDAIPRGSAVVTFWLRQDQQHNGLADSVVEAVNDWIAGEWPLTEHHFRILPSETSSRVALDRLGLRKVRIDHPGDTRPYLWYRGSTHIHQ